MGRIDIHNREVICSARARAEEMRIFPSPLEERMQKVLDRAGVQYEPQWIFYIYEKDGWIRKYYIADFYVPSRKIIIEVDGKFHDEHRQHDKMRTREIQSQYPGVEVLRYKWKDVADEELMEDLVRRVR